MLVVASKNEHIDYLNLLTEHEHYFMSQMDNCALLRTDAMVLAASIAKRIGINLRENKKI